MPPSSANERPNRMLAVKLADLGDLLTVTPALQALRAAHPNVRIDLLVPPSSASLLNGAPFIDRVLTFDKFAFDSPWGLFSVRRVLGILRFLLGLRLARYDTVLFFHHFTTSWGTAKFRALAVASGARTKAGLDNGAAPFLTSSVPDLGFGASHEADYWLQVAGVVGANAAAGWRASVPVSTANRDQAAAHLAGKGGPLVALHPGAGGYSRARIWPAGRFLEVACALVSERGAHIVLLGGPDETEAASQVEHGLGEGKVTNLAGKTTIHETAALIERCDLFVGNDSGPMHLAAAVGTPVVAVFGPSNSAAWGPYTPPGEESRHSVVTLGLPCQPCFYRGHSLGLREGCGTRPCLNTLPPRRVLDACLSALDAASDAKC